MRHIPRFFKTFILLIIPVLLLPGSLPLSSKPGDGGRTPLRQWGYLVSGTLAFKSDEDYLRKVLPRYDALCFTGPRLGRSGRLILPASGAWPWGVRVLESRLLPMITFLSVSEGRAMLSSKKGRARATEEIAAFIARGGYAGVHLDFEYLPPGDRGLLAEFLKELRPAMKGKKITMAVFPPVEFPAPWSGFHDLRTIGPFLDEVVLMCYDYHRPGTGPGPVTDLLWAERNIAEVLKHLRPEQVWLGMPAYGYSWNEAGKTAVISARTGVREARIRGGSRHPSGTLYYELGDKGARKRAFVADARTRELMAGLARRYNLRGAALWRLGMED